MRTDSRLKPLLNHGESTALDIAQAVCDQAGTKAFAKIRIADVVTIENSGLPNDLYRYALSAHFDVLVSKDNKVFLAIEFDGGGHDNINDEKKAAICNRFGIPMVRVRESHLNSKLFEDTAVGFFIWQLLCVDEFLAKFASDPYEPYDPEFFINVPGKTLHFPFAYAQRWQAKLIRPFQKAASRFDEKLRDLYSHGLLQFGTVAITFRRKLEYRSIYGQRVSVDHLVLGEASLALEVCGLQDRRLELFGQLENFVEGMAAEQMHHHAIRFLNGEEDSLALTVVSQKAAMWEAEGFRLRRAHNFPHST